MEKKKWVLVGVSAVALILGLVVAACGSSPDSSGSSSYSAQGSYRRADTNAALPDWYMNPPEDYSFVYGAGQAKMGNESRSQRAAENRARESVAFQVSVMVDAMQKDFTEEGGTDDDPAASNFFQAVNRQLASEVLRDARISKRWKGADATWFALAEYPKAAMAATIKKMAENSASKLAAAKTQLVMEEMDAQLAKKQEKMNPVDHD
jgi:hypothetical protein